MSEEKDRNFEHLYFRKRESHWGAYNNLDEYLGLLQLENVGRHMHWCWYQETGIRMTPGCLQNVKDMQKELFKERKKDG